MVILMTIDQIKKQNVKWWQSRLQDLYLHYKECENVECPYCKEINAFCQSIDEVF